MVNVAIIPARGGSKRLPGKNIRPFFGHPAIAYSIAAAQNSGLFERVIVSTDDPLTGQIAEWYGADYIPRPPELATENAGLVEVSLHALDWLKTEGVEPDALCQLMPNCPLRRGGDIRAHYELFMAEERKFQISVIGYRGVYPHWAMHVEADGRAAWVFGDYLVPSQSLGMPVCPTGAIWWVRVADFREQRAFYGNPYHIAEMDANRGIDIDRADDWELADLLVRGLRDRDGFSPLEPVQTEPYSEGMLA
jgi:pseudaminic acid cytidylyltransferase